MEYIQIIRPKIGINENSIKIVRSPSHTRKGNIHPLFIIWKLWRYRLVRGQIAKERVESVKAVFRQAHLVIGRVGRWVGRKKRHWRLTSRRPSLQLRFIVLPLPRPKFLYKAKYSYLTSKGTHGHEHRVRQLYFHMWTRFHRSSVYLPSGPSRPSKHPKMASRVLESKEMRIQETVLFPPRSTTCDKKERLR